MWLYSGFPSGILCGMRAQGTCSEPAQLGGPWAAGLEHPPAWEGVRGSLAGTAERPGWCALSESVYLWAVLGFGGKKSNRIAPWRSLKGISTRVVWI